MFQVLSPEDYSQEFKYINILSTVSSAKGGIVVSGPEYRSIVVSWCLGSIVVSKYRGSIAKSMIGRRGRILYEASGGKEVSCIKALVEGRKYQGSCGRKYRVPSIWSGN